MSEKKQKIKINKFRKTIGGLKEGKCCKFIPGWFCLCVECCSSGGFWSAQPHDDVPSLSAHALSYSYAEQKHPLNFIR